MNSTILTTGQVARFCCVSQRTVRNWLTDELLKSFKIPGTNVRRVSREQLGEFLRANHIPHVPLDEVLVAGNVPDVTVALSAVFTCSASLSPFTIGELLVQGEYACLVIDLVSIGKDEAARMARRAAELNPRMVVIGLHAEDVPPAFDGDPFAELFRKPFDVALLVERISSRLR